jgi:hypothetical protein
MISKKMGAIRPVNAEPSIHQAQMNSEPAKTFETVGFRFPALVSLTPKRRFKVMATREGELDSGEAKPAPGLMQGRPRLKRSGRIVFGWPGSVKEIRATS